MAKLDNKTKPEKSHTDKIIIPDGSKSLTWSIRDIDIETRMIIAKAAKLNGKTISQYIMDDVRAFAQSQIVQTRQPATSQDLENQISVMNLLERIEMLESRVGKSFFKRVLGL